jgi:hypothetical protein
MSLLKGRLVTEVTCSWFELQRAQRLLCHRSTVLRSGCSAKNLIIDNV